MNLSKIAIASLLIVSSASLALAQGQAAPGAGGRGRFAACREDAQKFCADKRGPDRRQCMQDNRDKLSDACKAAMASARPAGQ